MTSFVLNPFTGKLDAVGASTGATHQGYDVLTDVDANGRTIYLGHALPGTATSAAAWRIRKLEYDATGGFIGAVFANGSDLFSFVWDNRATYTYQSLPGNAGDALNVQSSILFVDANGQKWKLTLNTNGTVSTVTYP